MGGGKSKTVYQQSNVENPYDDAWIRDKFGNLDLQGVGFQNWMDTRKAAIGNEQRFREQLQTGLSGLQAQQAANQAHIQNLKEQGSGMQANFAGLSQAQSQQMKDLYNLANQAGSGVYGVQGPQGITFTKPKTQGTNAFKQGQLQTGSLNI